MRAALLSVGLLLAAMLAGCSLLVTGAKAPPGPEDAFANLRQALAQEDWGSVYDLAASPNTKRFFENDFTKMKKEMEDRGGAAMFAESVIGVSAEEYARMTARDYFVRNSRTARRASGWGVLPTPEQIRIATVVGSRVVGETAVLTIELGDYRRPMGLHREEGRWYFQLLDDD